MCTCVFVCIYLCIYNIFMFVYKRICYMYTCEDVCVFLREATRK